MHYNGIDYSHEQLKESAEVILRREKKTRSSVKAWCFGSLLVERRKVLRDEERKNREREALAAAANLEEHAKSKPRPFIQNERSSSVIALSSPNNRLASQSTNGKQLSSPSAQSPTAHMKAIALQKLKNNSNNLGNTTAKSPHHSDLANMMIEITNGLPPDNGPGPSNVQMQQESKESASQLTNSRPNLITEFLGVETAFSGGGIAGGGLSHLTRMYNGSFHGVPKVMTSLGITRSALLKSTNNISWDNKVCRSMHISMSDPISQPLFFKIFEKTLGISPHQLDRSSLIRVHNLLSEQSINGANLSLLHSEVNNFPAMLSSIIRRGLVGRHSTINQMLITLLSTGVDPNSSHLTPSYAAATLSSESKVSKDLNSKQDKDMEKIESLVRASIGLDISNSEAILKQKNSKDFELWVKSKRQGLIGGVIKDSLHSQLDALIHREIYSPVELQQFLASVLRLDQQEARLIMEACDVRGTGVIKLEDFLKFLQLVPPSVLLEELWIRLLSYGTLERALHACLPHWFPYPVPIYSKETSTYKLNHEHETSYKENINLSVLNKNKSKTALAHELNLPVVSSMKSDTDSELSSSEENDEPIYIVEQWATMFMLMKAGLEFEAARRIYMSLDTDRNGYIDVANLKHALTLSIPCPTLDAFKNLLGSNYKSVRSAFSTLDMRTFLAEDAFDKNMGLEQNNNDNETEENIEGTSDLMAGRRDAIGENGKIVQMSSKTAEEFGIQKVIREADVSQSGPELTYKEFDRIMSSLDLRTTDSSNLFKLLDKDGNGKLDLNEFITAVGILTPSSAVESFSLAVRQFLHMPSNLLESLRDFTVSASLARSIYSIPKSILNNPQICSNVDSMPLGSSLRLAIGIHELMEKSKLNRRTIHGIVINNDESPLDPEGLSTEMTFHNFGAWVEILGIKWSAIDARPLFNLLDVDMTKKVSVFALLDTTFGTKNNLYSLNVLSSSNRMSNEISKEEQRISTANTNQKMTSTSFSSTHNIQPNHINQKNLLGSNEALTDGLPPRLASPKTVLNRQISNFKFNPNHETTANNYNSPTSTPNLPLGHKAGTALDGRSGSHSPSTSQNFTRASNAGNNNSNISITSNLSNSLIINNDNVQLNPDYPIKKLDIETDLNPVVLQQVVKTILRDISPVRLSLMKAQIQNMANYSSIVTKNENKVKQSLSLTSTHQNKNESARIDLKIDEHPDASQQSIAASNMKFDNHPGVSLVTTTSFTASLNDKDNNTSTNETFGPGVKSISRSAEQQQQQKNDLDAMEAVAKEVSNGFFKKKIILNKEEEDDEEEDDEVNSEEIQPHEAFMFQEAPAIFHNSSDVILKVYKNIKKEKRMEKLNNVNKKNLSSSSSTGNFQSISNNEKALHEKLLVSPNLFKAFSALGSDQLGFGEARALLERKRYEVLSNKMKDKEVDSRANEVRANGGVGQGPLVDLNRMTLSKRKASLPALAFSQSGKLRFKQNSLEQDNTRNVEEPEYSQSKLILDEKSAAIIADMHENELAIKKIGVSDDKIRDLRGRMALYFKRLDKTLHNTETVLGSQSANGGGLLRTYLFNNTVAQHELNRGKKKGKATDKILMERHQEQQLKAARKLKRLEMSANPSLELQKSLKTIPTTSAERKTLVAKIIEETKSKPDIIKERQAIINNLPYLMH